MPDVESGGAKQGAGLTENMTIVAVVTFYFVISISLVFLNKNVMAKELEFPIFVTWFQLVVALVCCTVLGELGKHFPLLSRFPPLQYDTAVGMKVAPLAFVFVGMIAFNNLCLLYVEVTFYQVARSSTIFFSMLFTYLILGQKTSSSAIQACAVVMLGFVVGSAGEINFTWAGVIYGVLSSVFVALYGIYVKRCDQYVESSWHLLMYNTINSIVVMFPMIFLWGEYEGLSTSDALGEQATWVSLTITGLVGFLINIAIFLQITYTTPLTNNICGTAKACVQSLLAWVIYRNPISGMNALGIFMTIAGSAWYSRIRYLENEAKRAAERAAAAAAAGGDGK